MDHLNGQLTPAAFLSYAHADDQNDNGGISRLRVALQREIRLQVDKEFAIFQDTDDIPWGTNWSQRIERVLDGSTFLIPIITPAFFRSDECMREVDIFVDRERQLGRQDLILPIYYVDCPEFELARSRSDTSMLARLAVRQHTDWRQLRIESFDARPVRSRLMELAGFVRDALTSPGAIAASMDIPASRNRFDATSTGSRQEFASRESAHRGSPDICGSPELARRRLGSELRRMRATAGITLIAAARHLEIPNSRLTQLENGLTIPRLRDVRDLIELYGSDYEVTPIREKVMALCREARGQTWYDEYGNLLRTGSPLHRFIGLECSASEVLAYNGVYVPGLLQTQRYANAIYSALRPDASPADVSRLVEMRMRRKSSLHRNSGPLRLTAIVDESVIRRSVGEPELMREQLHALLALAEGPCSAHMNLGIIPFSVGLHPLVGSEFSALCFDDEMDQDVVFLEGLGGVTFYEKPTEVAEYLRLYRLAHGRALHGDDFVRYVRAQLP